MQLEHPAHGNRIVCGSGVVDAPDGLGYKEFAYRLRSSRTLQK
jgi:hypothetical protein